MKSKTRIQRHPRQENKTGKAIYASTTSTNSSTIQVKPDANDMPEGAETELKRNRPDTGKNRQASPTTPKQ